MPETITQKIIAIAFAASMALTGSLATVTAASAAGGCGAGKHRGPYNGCLNNYANPAAHACPRGYHVGPDGGCKGNGR
jgi:hypothetical protein